MLKLLGHCLEGMFKVFLVSDKFDHIEALGHYLEEGFEIFLTSDKMDQLESKRSGVHSVNLIM